jgi:hypothetical protein
MKNGFLPNTNKNNRTKFNKILIATSNSGKICLNQACKISGVYRHSKSIFKQFNEFTLPDIESFSLDSGLKFLKELKQKLHLKHIKLACDETDVAYYGDYENFYIQPSDKKKAGAKGYYKYLTISTTNRNCKIAIFTMLLAPGYNTEQILPDILDEIQKIIIIKQITFDRGFEKYVLFDYLQKRKIKYLAFLKSNNVHSETLNEMHEGEFKTICRERKYSKDKSTHRVRLKFVYLKDHYYSRDKFKNDWIFVTNMSFGSASRIVTSYKNRWGIETLFRVVKDSFLIKTTSTNPIIRATCMFFSMYHYNLWQYAKATISARITAVAFIQTIIYGFKQKFSLKYAYEDKILEVFGLT